MKLYLLAKLPAWPGSMPGFQTEPFVLMRRVVVALFADMERKGELD
jgi:hypothetical protein